MAVACGRGLLVLIYVIVAVGILEACDVPRPALNFEIGFENLDVEELALLRAGALGACEI